MDTSFTKHFFDLFRKYVRSYKESYLARTLHIKKKDLNVDSQRDEPLRRYFNISSYFFYFLSLFLCLIETGFVRSYVYR